MSFQAYLDNIEKKTGLTPRNSSHLRRSAASISRPSRREKSSSGSRTTTTWGGGMPWRSSM